MLLVPKCPRMWFGHEAARRFLREFSVLPLEDAARRAYGRLRTRLERQGKREHVFSFRVLWKPSDSPPQT